VQPAPDKGEESPFVRKPWWRNNLSEQQLQKQTKYRAFDDATEQDAEFASKDEIIAALEYSYDTIPQFHERLLYFALSKIRFYFGEDTFNGFTAEDAVQNVLESILAMRRKWYTKKIPDFHKFIRLALLSSLRNEKNKKERGEEVPLFDEEGEFGKETLREILKEFGRQDLTEHYLQENFEQLILKCMDELKDDVYASFVFEQRIEGCRSNIEIAKTLGIEVRDVECALKRIKNTLSIVSNKKRSRSYYENR
jgi:DNA-directed RNA polymerase specialized sigma24 family protein